MEPVLYFAPGAGLGHLNRALAVCLALREIGVPAEIVTASPFAEGFSRAARFPVVRLRRREWKEAVPRLVESLRPPLIVADTFPFGIRGEWRERPRGVRTVYVARRLRLQNYREAGDWLGFDSVIAAEPLSPDHARALEGARVVRLPGRIRLAPGAVNVAVPEGLERALRRGNTWLVVHSGPEEELRRLIRVARERMPEGAELAAITPWRVEDAGCACFEYYPAANIVERAAGVVSGAGYNIVADMTHARERLIATAFERRYDDQAGRLASLGAASEGTDAAAEAIAVLV
jgi:hypothetical protein